MPISRNQTNIWKAPFVFREEELNLLVADDNVLSRTELRRILTSIAPRAHLTEADTAEAAIVALTASPFDCAFLDYSFGDGNALKVLNAIRAAGVSTPVVI